MVCMKKLLHVRVDMYVCVCILGTVVYTFCKVCMYVMLVCACVKYGCVCMFVMQVCVGRLCIFVCD